MSTTRIAALILLLSASAAAENWPDLSRPAAATGGGEQDAGVVVGIEGYGFVPPVSGAEANAKAWYDYLTRTRGAGPANIKLLLGDDATREEILEAAQAVAAKAGPKGTLWFIFIGHGAPSGDGQDGLLVGVDAQQKASSLQKRSLKRQELLDALAKSKAGSISVILDACFSGRSQDGSSLAPGLQPLVTVAAGGSSDPRMVVLTAAKGNQFAGALPGSDRPAFSYLTLGALRGWAGNGPVTAGALLRYAAGALDATLRGRNQTPDLMGKDGAVMGVSAGEKAPDLASLAKATAGGGPDFQVTSLAAVPKAKAPKALDASKTGIDFGSVDVAALEKYDAASELDKGQASPEEKAARWRTLAKDAPSFASLADKRAEDWDRFAAQSNAAQEAMFTRLDARDSDWAKLARLLPLKVVPAKEKALWSAKFVAAYLDSPGLEPEMAKVLAPHAAPATRKSLDALAAKTPVKAAAPPNVADLQWVRIPGGTFTMGSTDSSEGPMRRVRIKPFYLTKSAVTNKQYRACVAVGVCKLGDDYCTDGVRGDDQPVVCVSWQMAKTFADWAGGRLPSEAEWEYAARSAGKDKTYPWGDAEPTCDLAVIGACKIRDSQPVCSRPLGNTEQGLCDMAGNEHEWVQDWLHDTYEGAPRDGRAWEIPEGTRRVFRGGSVSELHPSSFRTTGRTSFAPEMRFSRLGFRVAY